MDDSPYPSFAHPIRRWLLALLALVLAACSAPAGPDVTGTPATPAPDDQPTPGTTTQPSNTRLPTDRIWVAVEGLSDQLAIVTDSGGVDTVPLPLNDGQLASDLTAAPSGSLLAYLVWSAEGRQRGIAVWNPAEADARLVAQPVAGYRIIGLAIAGDGSRIAYVQVEEGKLLEEARWRVDSIATAGGGALLIVDRQTLGQQTMPPVPFAWPAEGPLLLSANTPDGRAQGIYAVDVVEGTSTQIVEPGDDEVILSPALSPDAAYLAYLALDLSQAPANSPPIPSNVLRVRDLRLGEVVTMNPGDGRAIFGARWLPANRLLLDVVALSDAPGVIAAQSWAVADIGADPPWAETPTGNEREYLFDYAPYRDGIVYSTLPADGQWRLFLRAPLSPLSSPRTVDIGLIATDIGAPKIIYTPPSSGQATP